MIVDANATESRGLQPLALTLHHNGEPVSVTAAFGIGGAIDIKAHGEDAIKLAAMLEAETLQRAGTITYTQARQRIRDRQASPVAHLALQQTEALNRVLAVLRELVSVVRLMDHPEQERWPTDAEVDDVLAKAERELGRH